MKINAVWHSTHRMPQRATMKERARWHAAHAKHCGCRPIPATVQTYPLGKEVKPTQAPVVVGVADHNGWAMLVSVAAVDGEPTVIDRRRVELIKKGVPSQPYHHETTALGKAEAEQLVRRVKRSVAACTATALDRLSADLSPAYRVTSIAIRQPPLDALPATVADAHASYYVFCRADGMLYHSMIVSAARDRDWDVLLNHRGEEISKAAEALQMEMADVERFINDLKSSLGPPWSAEHRNAFAAGIAGLAKQVRLRAPRVDLAANRKTRRVANR
jgi:hypothetical protein